MVYGTGPGNREACFKVERRITKRSIEQILWMRRWFAARILNREKVCGKTTIKVAALNRSVELTLNDALFDGVLGQGGV